MDCEGEEYNILLKTDLIERVDKIALEYHGPGFLKLLPLFKEKGFRLIDVGGSVTQGKIRVVRK
jgi:hypothetical protein